MLPDGTTLAARAVQKVPRAERGHDYVERRLVDLGAPSRRAYMDPARWLADALDTVGYRRLSHPGCHRYAFRLGETARQRRRVEIAGKARTYPKSPTVADELTGDDEPPDYPPPPGSPADG